MPASSILPVALYREKLYFLFGKENPFEDSAKGFSDFGGGIEADETAFETALREGSEELTGFLGTSVDLKKRLSRTGVYKIKYTFNDSPKNTYIIHIFPFSYDTNLVEYFNNTHSFLWNRMDKTLLNDSKLFEKIEIDWFCEDDLQKRNSEYRPFYKDIVTEIIEHKEKIRIFLKNCIQKKQSKRRLSSHNVSKSKTRSTRRKNTQ